MRTLKKVLVFALLTAAAGAGIAYGLDDIWARYRGKPVSAIKIDRYYADRNKWNEVEYSVGTPEIETCIQSLFPHFGLNPCWYLMRHTTQQVGNP
jgi:hypothetical protein